MFTGGVRIDFFPGRFYFKKQAQKLSVMDSSHCYSDGEFYVLPAVLDYKEYKDNWPPICRRNTFQLKVNRGSNLKVECSGNAIIIRATREQELGFAQSNYVKQIDSIVERIKEIDDFYTAEDGTRKMSTDSSLIGFDSRKYIYSDEGKTLIHVNQWIFNDKDSLIIDYYFKNKKLVKVFTSGLIKDSVNNQSIYFKDKKVIYSTTLPDIKFTPVVYLQNAEKFIRFRAKVYAPNFIN